MQRIGAQYGKSPAQVCLRWLVQQGVAAIPRSSKVEHLSDNIDVFDFALSVQDMADIFAMAKPQGRITDFGLAPKWD